MHEFFLGFQRFLTNPRQFGGFTSGRFLAALITREIDPNAGAVLELGPGTGVFTRALVARDVPEDNLILVEADPLLAARLAKKFPKAVMLNQDAASISPRDVSDAAPPSAVVSGLPLLNFTSQQVYNIIESAFALLGPGGAFYQFTYGRRCPVSDDTLATLGLSARRVGRVWRNVPPASVYRLVRR